MPTIQQRAPKPEKVGLFRTCVGVWTALLLVLTWLTLLTTFGGGGGHPEYLAIALCFLHVPTLVTVGILAIRGHRTPEPYWYPLVRMGFWVYVATALLNQGIVGYVAWRSHRDLSSRMTTGSLG